jgi:hypothetical protein
VAVDSTKVELFVSACALTAAVEPTNMLNGTFWVVQGMQHQLRHSKCGACCFLDCTISIRSRVNPRSLPDTDSFLKTGLIAKNRVAGTYFPFFLNGKSNNTFPFLFKPPLLKPSSLHTIFIWGLVISPLPSLYLRGYKVPNFLSGINLLAPEFYI